MCRDYPALSFLHARFLRSCRCFVADGAQTLTQLYLSGFSYISYLISTAGETQKRGSRGRERGVKPYVSYDECVRCSLFGLDSVASALFKFSTHPGWLWLSSTVPLLPLSPQPLLLGSVRLWRNRPAGTWAGPGPLTFVEMKLWLVVLLPSPVCVEEGGGWRRGGQSA